MHPYASDTGTCQADYTAGCDTAVCCVTQTPVFSFQKSPAIELNQLSMTQQASQQMTTGKHWQPYLHHTSGVLPHPSLYLTAASAWCEPQLSCTFSAVGIVTHHNAAT